MSTLCVILLLFMLMCTSSAVADSATQQLNSPLWELNMESLQKIFTEGKQEMEKIQSQAISVAYDNCYQALKPQFLDSCKNLHSQDKFRLALAVYNCQREEAGFTTLRCSSKDTIEQCAERMGSESNAYQTVVLLTHHVENMCYFVQSSQFEKQTSAIINLLASESLKTVQMLHAMNEDHKLLQHQVRQTLAEQMKTYREHVKMGESIDRLQKMEEEHNTRVEQQHSDILSQTTDAMDRLKALQDLQELLSKKQQEIRDSVNDHFRDLMARHENLSLSMEESINTSRIIARDYHVISQHMESLHNDQKSLFDSLTMSHEKQDELLKGQHDMKVVHDSILESTVRIKSDIRESSILFQDMMKASQDEHLALLKTVDDSKQHILQMNSIQKKALEETQRGLSSIHTTMQSTAQQLEAFNEDVTMQFSRVYGYLQYAQTILTRVDYSLGVFAVLGCYGGVLVLSVLITSFVNRLRKARIPLMVITVLGFIMEFILGVLHGKLGIYSVRLFTAVAFFSTTHWFCNQKSQSEKVDKLMTTFEEYQKENRTEIELTRDLLKLIANKVSEGSMLDEWAMGPHKHTAAPHIAVQPSPRHINSPRRLIRSRQTTLSGEFVSPIKEFKEEYDSFCAAGPDVDDPTQTKITSFISPTSERILKFDK